MRKIYIIITVVMAAFSCANAQIANSGPSVTPAPIITGSNSKKAAPVGQNIPDNKRVLIQKKGELENRIENDTAEITHVKDEQAKAALSSPSNVWLQERFKAELTHTETDLTNTKETLRLVIFTSDHGRGTTSQNAFHTTANISTIFC